ncbi:MAG TPA: S8 family serine peptidase [Geminicoccaceae bacterium]|nr:S8 family serine peptidase [Geminicoccus sp.]HMU48358.1 S8 family serine peptidase [Geminicoccaceae bacterium]
MADPGPEGRPNLADLWSGGPPPPGRPEPGGDHTSPVDEILVVDIAAADLQQALAQGFSLRERRHLGALGLTILRLGLPPGLSAEAAISRFEARASARALAIDASYEVEAASCGGEPCWEFQMIGWQAEDVRCGTGMRIGMIDTGIDPDQPVLRGRRIESRSFVPRSAPHSHGTAIAAILVGRDSGVSGGLLPAAELVAADVFGADALGRARAAALNIASALDWLAVEKVDVINISIAGPANALLELAIGKVLAKGIPIVAAAGNGGPAAGPAYPAAYPGVIAATAVDRDMEVYASANRGSYIAFAAPGVGLRTPGADGSALGSGTSYASAFLTAVVAEHIRQAPDPPAAIEPMLAATALDLGAPGRDEVFGWGLVRAGSLCRG